MYYGINALFGEERYQDSCEALEDLEVKFLIAKGMSFLSCYWISRFATHFIKNIGHEFWRF